MFLSPLGVRIRVPGRKHAGTRSRVGAPPKPHWKLVRTPARSPREALPPENGVCCAEEVDADAPPVVAPPRFEPTVSGPPMPPIPPAAEPQRSSSSSLVVISSSSIFTFDPSDWIVASLSARFECIDKQSSSFLSARIASSAGAGAFASCIPWPEIALLLRWLAADFSIPSANDEDGGKTSMQLISR